MCFHGNQLSISWAIKYPFIKLFSKYHSPGFICFSTMLALVISSLDEIYCTPLRKLPFNTTATVFYMNKVLIDKRTEWFMNISLY